jgi:hypothetical protein
MGWGSKRNRSDEHVATVTGSHDCRANEEWESKYWEPASYPGDPLANHYTVTYACRVCGTVTRQQREAR